MQVAFKKGKDHVENIFHLQGQDAGGRRVRNAKHNSK